MKRKYWGILGKWLVTWQQAEFKADDYKGELRSCTYFSMVKNLGLLDTIYLLL